MSKFTSTCALLCALSFTYVAADEFPSEENTASPSLLIPSLLPTKHTAEAPFSPFTGKIKGKKVRLRVQPDLEGHVIKELEKNELISVVGEKGDFWAVNPPAGTKAYVFRSFILDNIVEGNRVNVRLEPDLEAPIIGHFNAGDRVNGVISALNSKWLEIAAPAQTRFYIAKEFVDYLGSPEVKAQIDKRKQAVGQLLDAALLLSKAELRKPFEEIDISRISRNYMTVINEYTDFPEHVESAKESLASLQEAYLQKKISFLEQKASHAENISSEEIAVMDTETPPESEERHLIAMAGPTDRMKMWEPIEESLYLSWTRLNEDRNLNEYYDEQNLNAVALTGILEAYTTPVKNKPGDFLLRDKDLPIAYLYSTMHNLQQLVGKKVTVIASPRSNNNFAFPAYFVLSVE